MKRLMKYFFQGLLFLAPIAITIYIIFVFFHFVDGILKSYLTDWFSISIPGLGIVIIFVFISLLGFIGQTIIARPFTRLFDKLIKKTPIIGLVYSSLKDLMGAFVGKEKKFNHAVLVKVNLISDLEKLGFITETDLTQLKIKDKVAVYFPHSYNFSGEMFIVPAKNITPVDLPSSDVMKFIVSGGIAKL